MIGYPAQWECTDENQTRDLWLPATCYPLHQRHKFVNYRFVTYIKTAMDSILVNYSNFEI